MRVSPPVVLRTPMGVRALAPLEEHVRTFIRSPIPQDGWDVAAVAPILSFMEGRFDEDDHRRDTTAHRRIRKTSR